MRGARTVRALVVLYEYEYNLVQHQYNITHLYTMSTYSYLYEYDDATAAYEYRTVRVRQGAAQRKQHQLVVGFSLGLAL